MLRNSATAWGAVAQFLHWTGALVVLVLVAHGWWMTEFPPRAERFAHYQWHASLGYAALAFTLLRLLWRWMNTVPHPPAGATRREQLLAQAGHAGLYVLLLGSAVAGWALAGTFRRPMDSVFGLFTVPALVSSQERTLHLLLERMHIAVSWALVVLVALHVGAAVWHHAARKNDVLRRMLPRRGH